MSSILAFFRIIRWPNLVFIAITQFLFYHCVFFSLQYPQTIPSGSQVNLFFPILAIASVLIAAAGYIINDYFDIQIDQVNKPDRVVIDKHIKRRWAIVWHWILSFVGLILSWLISTKMGIWTIFYGNSLSVILLLIYSTHLKKKTLWGNIVISLLTAWSIVVVYFFAGGHIFNFRYQFNFYINKWVIITTLYGSFAFMISIIREVVKDMEDFEGDIRYGCNTMPIRWGIPAAKIFAGVWMVVAMACLAAIAFYAIQKGWLKIGAYLLIFQVMPLYLLVNRLSKAKLAGDYHRISSWLKWLMMGGILSMLFFGM